MNSQSTIDRLQLITNATEKQALLQQIEAFCKGGGRWVQLRLKNTPSIVIQKMGTAAKEICQSYQAKLIINDAVEIARTLKADGVHLGQNDLHPVKARAYLGADYIIGHTVNRKEDLTTPILQNCDYLGVGPFRYTTTKKQLSPILGDQGYREITHSTLWQKQPLPLIAVGGITINDIPNLQATGVYGYAVSSAITQSKDPEHNTQQFLTIIQKFLKL